MRISDWIAYVCASDLATTPQCSVICPVAPAWRWRPRSRPPASSRLPPKPVRDPLSPLLPRNGAHDAHPVAEPADIPAAKGHGRRPIPEGPISDAWAPWSTLPRSEEHTSELQSLMRISYAVFCLKKKNTQESKY